MLPQVSVIIPTYNRAALLEKAVESVLAQTIEDIEILVCDDGSTDNSRERIHSFRNPKVRWIPGEHSGNPAPARNKGMSFAQGEWLAFLDSDDIWFPDKLARQLCFLEKTGLLASATNALRQGPDGNIGGQYQHFHDSKINLRQILRSNWVICSSAMINRSLLPWVAGFPEAPAFKGIEDYALWLRVASLTDFAYDKTPCLCYMDDALNSFRGILPPREAARVERERRKRVIQDFLLWSTRNPRGKAIDRVFGKSFLLREKCKSLLFR